MPASEHPQPFAACSERELAAVEGVLTDIDDTLTRDGAIEPAALAALQHLHDAHMPVIAVTGRSAGWSEPFALAWPVAAIVAENGAVMLRRAADGSLARDFADPPALRAANALRLAACTRAILAAVPGATPACDSPGRITDIAIDHAEHARLDAAQIDAVVALMRRHGLTATVSSIHINGWIGDHDKWSGARWAVCEVCGRALDAQRWLYVGDSANDAPMFERLHLGVGVANIAAWLPRMAVAPRWITAGERGAGFAEVADRLIAARRR